MSRTVTLLGYAVILAAAVGLEVVARRVGRLPTLAEALTALLRRRGCRLLVGAGWLWLGWHLFVRVQWR